MRTHLLRTFHPSFTLDPDTGRAVNDDDYHGDRAPLAANSKPFVIVAKAGEQSADGANDDYYLGGYAGI
jgi:hypothetical protein